MDAGQTETHNDRVKREFVRQSDSFARQDSFFGSREVGEWIVGGLPLNADSEVVDLAGGAGHLARFLSTRAHHFVVLDLTPEQLEIGREAVSRDGITNIEFVEGDASHTPFADASFDLVMCRFALHHMTRPEEAVVEAGRICRPGGHLAMIDMVAPDDPDAAATLNRLERLRDPSHTAALTTADLEAVATREGEIITRKDRDHTFLVEPWLERAGTPDADRKLLIGRLREELDGTESTGLHPHVTDERLAITQRWNLLVVQNH